MRLGIEKLDRVLGEIEGGDVLLIETIGSLGIELLSKVIRGSRDAERRVMILLSKGASERRLLPIDGTDLLILGKNVHAERLYEILHRIKGLPEGSLLVAIRLDVLLLFRPREAIYMFMEDLVSTVQEKKIIFVVTVDKRNLKEKDIAIFENLATHIIDITETVDGSNVTLVMRVKKSPGGRSGFCRFSIEEGNISIGEPLVEG
ncbi:hypothetical protein E3E36_03155 [Thermococcus sp. M36]|uniref:hypothetical protein n=1 Tax=Thermococcus sp. M36 TaxID=1638261 RepID=UPI0014387D29|nr:hypothetical protein [Thermococcus sp. M36]NJE05156.1 hypothetical protein [Thermococcus sp. M36]